MQVAIAAGLIAKYAGIVVMSDFEGSTVFPLLLESLNIFTDPQRPMVVTQGIYDINGPDENSPVLITSNFSLTYFIVSGEIEASRVPAWLMIQGHRGPVGSDRLGGRQVRRRRCGHVYQEVRHYRQGQT